MAGKDPDNYVVLHADVPAADERVRAVLAGWGLGEDSIRRLLTEGHAGPSPAIKRAAAPAPDETASLLRGFPVVREYASH